MVLLISSTLIIAAITGFVSLNDGESFGGAAGQVAHGLLSIVCFAVGRCNFLAVRLDSWRD
jgi:hypothetical protein